MTERPGRRVFERMSTNPPPARPSWPLEPGEQTLRAWLDGAADLVLEHLRALPDLPASNAQDALAEARALIEPLPEEGADALELLGTFMSAGA